MTIHVYRYQWLGVPIASINERLALGFPATFSDFGPEILQDIQVDDSQKGDLDEYMGTQGFSFVQQDPPTAIPQAFAQFQFSGALSNGTHGIADIGADPTGILLTRDVNYPYSGPNTVLNTIGVMLADQILGGVTLTFDVHVNGSSVEMLQIFGPQPQGAKFVQAFGAPAPLITSAHVTLICTAVGLVGPIGVQAYVSTGN
jgi:hypothetical protein